MKTYYIKYTSRLVTFCLAMTLIMLLFVLLFAILKPYIDSYINWVFILSVAAFAVLLLRISMKIATVVVEFKLDKDNLTIKTGTQTKLNRRLNYEIDLKQIESYLYEKDKAFDKFILTMKNKEVIKFFHNTDFDDSDDFSLFLNDFIITITKLNALQRESNSSFKPIQKQASIYERPVGKLYAVVAAIIVVVASTLMIWNKNGDLSGYGPMTVGLGWALFYLAEFYMTKRKTSR